MCVGGGKPLFEPVRLSYHTASYLRLLETIPHQIRRRLIDRRSRGSFNAQSSRWAPIGDAAGGVYTLTPAKGAANGSTPAPTFLSRAFSGGRRQYTANLTPI